MLLVYSRLYIIYTLAGFLFGLDQSNICNRDIQKIESSVRKCIPIPQKIYNLTKKRLRTPDEVEKYFPGFMSFIDVTERQIPRPIDKTKKEDILFRQEEKTYCCKDAIDGQQTKNHNS